MSLARSFAHGAICLTLLTPLAAGAAERVPIAVEANVQPPWLRFTPQTLTLAIEIDREQARLIAFTRKPRPYLAPAVAPAPRVYTFGESLQVDVTLLGAGRPSYNRRVDIGPICLDHGPEDAAHVEGDTILVHRDSFLVELPDVPGMDTVEIAYHSGDPSRPERRLIGYEPLDPARFVATAGNDAAPPTAGNEDLITGTTGAVFWPQAYGDPDIYTVYGNEAEAATRINIVLVPDGYVYAEKALMQQHAQAMVTAFRAKTPYKEHDPFINYILVYAYSTASGTDQCDCSIVVDTAMNTRFPDAGYPCNNLGNRCLYYGTANGGPDCDTTTTSANIAAAELRAPAQDQTVVMVNTARYGGCGGSRAVYSAGNASGGEISIHELGHSMAALSDEYQGNSGCGSSNGYNVSTNATNGAWPEWIPTLGAPLQGARFYNNCIYRPTTNCNMRTLGVDFCPVCNQRWSLVYFGHSRVNPTAPIAGQLPASPVATQVGSPTNFSATTRLAVGAVVTNQFTWRLQGPGYPVPTEIASGAPTLIHSFTQVGTYTLTCEVIADTNFIKPALYGANVDTATWTVNVGPSSCDPIPAFAGLATATDISPCQLTGISLTWSAATFGPDGGTYTVFRDGVPIQTGITATSYVDLPGNSASHTYRVRAVTADCSISDTNTVDRVAADGSGDPPPTFAGITSAVDIATCAQTGIRLTFPAATFGPSGGTYRIYRDATLVASGVAASPYTDLPGNSASHSYRVNAVSTDCARSDGNTVNAGAADGSGDPVPVFAGIASANDRNPCAADGVDLTWSAAAFGPASGYYDVYRDGQRIATFVAASPYLDLPGDAASHSYRIVAASGDCGRLDGNAVNGSAADAVSDPAPVFAGLTAAGDLDACLATGVALRWDPATFGPAGGAYDVWRDSARVAVALASLAYIDQPGDRLVHDYRVVAVNPCGLTSGPALVLSAADAAIDPAAIPPDLGNTLAGRKAAGLVHLAWGTAAQVATYNLYRSDTPGTWLPAPDQSGLVLPELVLPDLGPPALLLYRASGSTCAGREGP